MMPSLWARYVTELRGGAVVFLEEEYGFMSYSLPHGDSVFVEDVYIVPECRDAVHALLMLSKVEAAGLKAEKTHTVFIVRVESAAAAYNLRIYLAMGFSPVSAESGNIWLKREIKAGE